MPADPPSLNFPPGAFEKEDRGDDAAFYAFPRLVTHIDDAAITALTDFYREILPRDGILLDLMSSWVSHLPDDVAYGQVIGHGMNTQELAANPRLDRWFVQDFNRNPVLPLADASIDAAMITVSIQYLQDPIAVLKEAVRVLRPGAPMTISFSNRCFPTKAVLAWRMADERVHTMLVGLYLRQAGFSEVETHRLRDGALSDPLTVVVGRA